MTAMRRVRALCLVLALAGLACAPAQAVRPDEVLADPAKEARARALSAQLRCLVCQNQSIDDSDAPLARDLRLIVREKIMAGAGDDEIRAFLVERYGAFVLLSPPLAWNTLLLWASPALLVLAGGAILWWNSRRRALAGPAALTAQERAELDRIAGEGSSIIPPSGHRLAEKDDAEAKSERIIPPSGHLLAEKDDAEAKSERIIPPTGHLLAEKDDAEAKREGERPDAIR